MSTQSVFLIFPHQLFEDVTPIPKGATVYLVEEYLFFTQYKFHKQKLVLHRASMKSYETYLSGKGYFVCYITAQMATHKVENLVKHLHSKKIKNITYYNVVDTYLHKHLSVTASNCNITLTELDTPYFINTDAQLRSYFADKKTYHQTSFYIQQRKNLGLLITDDGKPEGGSWTYDTDNRQKYPKNTQPPTINHPSLTTEYKKAIEYVETYYANNYGKINKDFVYPTTHTQSKAWLQEFLHTRFAQFGDYEDAIVQQEIILHHSVLSPMINCGLLTPLYVIEQALVYAKKYTIPLNSLEGFIRQILGWREYMRAIYLLEGTKQRNGNYWGFTRDIPLSYYDGTSSITPLNHVIHKVLATGYCHHIERLMVLGNIMLLSELKPDAVYQWFMELFIDAYDWVMVPNVYGMTQFADGGLITTKPYIAGSNYIFKMSDYKKVKVSTAGLFGDNWDTILDGLFWNFMVKQKHFFSQNPRLGMLLALYNKMPPEKQMAHKQVAESYLKSIS